MEKLTRNLIIGGVALSIIGVSAYLLINSNKDSNKDSDKKDSTNSNTTINVDKNVISQKEADFIAEKINKSVRKDMQQQAAYYQSLPDTKRESLSQEEERNAGLLKNLMGMEQQFKMIQNKVRNKITQT